MKCIDCKYCVTVDSVNCCISDTYDPDWRFHNKKSKKEGAEKCTGFLWKLAPEDAKSV